MPMKILFFLIFFCSVGKTQSLTETDSIVSSIGVDSTLSLIEIDSAKNSLKINNVEMSFKELRDLYKKHPIALKLLERGRNHKIRSIFSYSLGTVILCLPIIPLALNVSLNPLLVLGDIAIGTAGIYYGIEWAKKRNARFIESANVYNRSIEPLIGGMTLNLKYTGREVGVCLVF